MSTPVVTHLTRAGREIPVPLRDGACSTLRPLLPGESDPLLRVFDGMSSASRASRYLVGMAGLPSAMVRSLVDLDGQDRVAWLASAGGRPVGMARFIRVAPQTAEVAFEVVDAWQGRGLGTVLADTITTVAAALGVRRLTATVHPANEPSVRLLARFGMRLVVDDGLLEGESPLRLLDPAVVDRCAVVRLAAGHRHQGDGSCACRSAGAH